MRVRVGQHCSYAFEAECHLVLAGHPLQMSQAGIDVLLTFAITGASLCFDGGLTQVIQQAFGVVRCRHEHALRGVKQSAADVQHVAGHVAGVLAESVFY